MDLPELPDLSAERLAAVLARHGLSGESVARLPDVGIFNAILTIGDSVVLRVPRVHPVFVESAHKEAIAVPAARAAGVRTPALLAFDDTLEVLPVPYSLYERVAGETLEHLGLDAADSRAAYRELGRDLGRLHDGIDRVGPIADLELEGLPAPDDWPDELVREGYLGPAEARWISDWLARLRQRVEVSPMPDAFRHGDLQATNVMVSPTLAYLALLDWGACGWGNPAHDFAGVPAAAVPLLLDGYRDNRPVPRDGSFEAHIVYRQLHLALFLLRRPPQPGKSWAERPMAMLLDLVRFHAGSPEPGFEGLGP